MPFYSLFCNQLFSNNYSIKIEFISLITRGFELLSFARGFEYRAREFEYFPTWRFSLGFIGTRTRSNRCHSLPAPRHIYNVLGPEICFSFHLFPSDIGRSLTVTGYVSCWQVPQFQINLTFRTKFPTFICKY